MNENTAIFVGIAKTLDNQKKILEMTITASTDNTTVIVHNLSYNPSNDDMVVIYQGIILEENVNYVQVSGNLSIDLQNWSINTGEKIKFKIYKNMK